MNKSLKQSLPDFHRDLLVKLHKVSPMRVLRNISEGTSRIISEEIRAGIFRHFFFFFFEKFIKKEEPGEFVVRLLKKEY